MIYYFPGGDAAFPSGGVKTHYDHVRILNELGQDASILHVQPGFRCTWFPNDVPVAYLATTPLRPEDVLVTNEIMGPDFSRLAPGARKVVFNQNSHYTFRGYSIPPKATDSVPYTDPEVLGSIVLTPYCQNALHFAFPEHPVFVVPHGIDGTKWYPRDKKKQIAYMPRKHPDEAQQVFGYLHYSGALTGWDVVAIDGKTEAETAAILGESAVFFAFGYPEGGTLPPFEAMAAGCVVVGYGGFSSDEWIDQCGGELVQSGNTRTFVSQARRVLSWPFAKLGEWGLDSRATVLKVLSVQGEKDALKEAWEGLIL